MLADSQDVAAFYDGAVTAGAEPKVAANWVMGDIMAHLRAEKKAIADVLLTPAALAELLALIKEGAISGKARTLRLSRSRRAHRLLTRHASTDRQGHPARAAARGRQPARGGRGAGAAANLGHE